MVSKTEPQVDSITDDLSNVALPTNKSRDLDNTNANELFNRKPNVLVDNKIFPTKIDDQFDINLSACRSNCIADNKTSTGKLDNTSDTKPSTYNPDDVFNDKISCSKSDKKKCTNCGNFNAKAHCAGCHKAPNIDGTPRIDVRYCTRECQKAHWSAHRVECKNLQARKALFRAAWLMQKIWHTVRRESFDNCVVKSEQIDGELLIHEGDYNLEPTKREAGFYREFPDHIFENEQDAESCLNLLYCTDSLSHMYMINSWLLKGTCADVKEISVRVDKAARNVRYTGPEWDRIFIHEILQVRLHSGETYVIDLTGAQYGWYDPITEWSTYKMNCTETSRIPPFGIDGDGPLGSRAQSMLVSTFSEPWSDRTDMQRAIPMFNECLKRDFNKAFVQQVVSKFPRGSDVLKLPGPEFEAVEKGLLSKTKEITNNAAEKIDTILGVIQSEARIANRKLRESPGADTGEVLKQSLTKLAAFFNGEWSRDALTGRLTSISLKRFMEDLDYADKYMDGILPEQKLWGDLTLVKGLRHFS
ncbi:hypothetical protein D6D29_05474 [Aureobasidium pullulans]|nr:hypothetical protein D6D29_05474 [Aureobasidium pullulans]